MAVLSRTLPVALHDVEPIPPWPQGAIAYRSSRDGCQDFGSLSKSVSLSLNRGRAAHRLPLLRCRALTSKGVPRLCRSGSSSLTFTAVLLLARTDGLSQQESCTNRTLGHGPLLLRGRASEEKHRNTRRSSAACGEGRDQELDHRGRVSVVRHQSPGIEEPHQPNDRHHRLLRHVVLIQYSVEPQDPAS